MDDSELICSTRCHKGLTITEWTNSEGKLFRMNGPARILTYNDKRTELNQGIAKKEQWCQKPNEHYRKNDKPSEIHYFENNSIASEKWIYLNRFFRDNDEPAVINYYKKEGKSSLYGIDMILGVDVPKFKSKFWVDGYGQTHRKDGPAAIFYNEDGEIVEVEFYEYGNFIKTCNDREELRRFAIYG